MPELPEVEIVRRGLEPALMGKRLKNIKLNRSDLRIPIPQDFKQKLENQKITSTTRRGKYILVFNQNGSGFVLHLGMSGRIHIHDNPKSYEPTKHDHVIFDMEDKTRIVFNDPRRFGMLYLTTAESWQTEPPFSAMGPEPLGNDFSGPILAKKLSGRKTPIKNALLDQKIVAGIGNIYACEALHKSGINPHTLACDVQGSHAENLASAIRNVLNGAIAAGGSSLKDYAHTDGSLGYFQHSFSVYDREGLSCQGCDCDIVKTGGVVREMQSGRSTFYCAQRQR